MGFKNIIAVTTLLILSTASLFAEEQTPVLEPTFQSSPDYRQLMFQTAGIGGLMIGGMTVLWYAPEDFSQWYTKPDPTPAGFRNRWYQNIQRGPIWDGDIRLFNAYSHIHVGAAYAVMARDSGFGTLGAVVYANMMSLSWEYGPEAITEVPSWQDILMTGLVGGRVGLQFHTWKQRIASNGDKIWGSRLIGVSAKFLLDPFGYILRGMSDTPSQATLEPLVRLDSKKVSAFGLQLKIAI